MFKKKKHYIRGIQTHKKKQKKKKRDEYTSLIRNLTSDFHAITDPKIDRKMRSTNNPGNLRPSPRYKWIGQCGETPLGFVKFETPYLGIRALYITLCNYIKIHNLNTIRAIISRFAPPSENDTEVYIRFVSAKMKISDTQPIGTHSELLKLMTAIIRMENTAEDAAYFFSHLADPATTATLLKIHKNILVSPQKNNYK